MAKTSPETVRGVQRLGLFIKARREAMRPKMSQAEFGRLVGLNQKSVSRLEVGDAKVPLGPEVINEIPGVLGVQMAEVVRLLGYDLPHARTKIDESMLRDLEEAPQNVVDAVQLVLDGWRATQQATRRQAQP